MAVPAHAALVSEMAAHLGGRDLAPDTIARDLARPSRLRAILMGTAPAPDSAAR
ncbi:MAG: hypothetical protein ABI051_03575 [Vicinamibacterales bacterium]